MTVIPVQTIFLRGVGIRAIGGLKMKRLYDTIRGQGDLFDRILIIKPPRNKISTTTSFLIDLQIQNNESVSCDFLLSYESRNSKEYY